MRAFVLALVFAVCVAPAPRTFADDTKPPPGAVRLMAVGDVSLGWEVGRRIVRHGPQVPFANVVDQFDQADIVLANLECSISNIGDPWPDKRIHLRAPLAAADALVVGGIDAVSVANNHAIDFGRDAFAQELGLLDSHAVAYAGGGANATAAHAPLIIERNGLRIALLAYVMPFASKPSFSTREWAASATRSGLALATVDGITADVEAALSQSDLVAVFLHSGTEYITRPTKGQRRLAQAAIDAGAKLVIGSGPHVLQGYHFANNTLIAYSLGNFVFARFDGLSNDSAILDVTLSANGVDAVNWLPVVIENGIPRPAVGAEIDRILAELPQI